MRLMQMQIYTIIYEAFPGGALPLLLPFILPTPLPFHVHQNVSCIKGLVNVLYTCQHISPKTMKSIIFLPPKQACGTMYCKKQCENKKSYRARKDCISIFARELSYVSKNKLHNGIIMHSVTQTFANQNLITLSKFNHRCSLVPQIFVFSKTMLRVAIWGATCNASF